MKPDEDSPAPCSSRPCGWRLWMRAMRVHQWVKNLLIFVPAVVAHRYDAATVVSLIAAFFSFGICASSVYILNDILDLRSDQNHPTKKNRPFASGQLPLMWGIVSIPIALGLSVGIAAFLPWQFLATACVYYLLTLNYSLWVKRQAMLDVVVLACLYGIRLAAGGAVVNIPLSPWLMIFAVFIFFCLAMVKRCAEIIESGKNGGENAIMGRGYRQSDLPLLEMLAVASGCVSVLVFGLYVNAPAVMELYAHPHRLWAILVILLYWIGRVLLATHRGDMREDPVLYAIKDRVSIVCAALILGVMAASI